jgi:hypothetical protein
MSLIFMKVFKRSALPFDRKGGTYFSQTMATIFMTADNPMILKGILKEHKKREKVPVVFLSENIAVCQALRR